MNKILLIIPISLLMNVSLSHARYVQKYSLLSQGGSVTIVNDEGGQQNLIAYPENSKYNLIISSDGEIALDGVGPYKRNMIFIEKIINNASNRNVAIHYFDNQSDIYDESHLKDGSTLFNKVLNLKGGGRFSISVTTVADTHGTVNNEPASKKDIINHNDSSEIPEFKTKLLKKLEYIPFAKAIVSEMSNSLSADDYAKALLEWTKKNRPLYGQQYLHSSAEKKIVMRMVDKNIQVLEAVIAMGNSIQKDILKDARFEKILLENSTI